MGGKEAGGTSSGREGAGDRISSSFPASQTQLVLKVQGWKMSDATLVHPPVLPCGGGRTTYSWATLRTLRKYWGWGGRQGINRQKGQPSACPPLPNLLLLGDKTFNYRYLVLLRIPNVLIASPPRASFHGKIRVKSQGGKGENPHPVGSLPRRDREKKGDKEL